MTTQRLPFNANDYSHQMRSALASLEHAMQVVLNGGALLEQQLGHPLDPPAPRRLRFPIIPEKSAATPRTDDTDTRDADAPTGQPSEKAALLKELHDRPPSAKFTPTEAAVYLNGNEALLRSWRWNGRGPAFEGRGRFIRYTKANLDRFMAN